VKNQFAAMAATAATMLRATSAAAAMTTRMRGAASGENRPGAAGAFARRRAAAAPRRDAPLPRDRARRRECRASAHFRRAPSAMVSWEDSAAQQKRVSQVGGERFVDFFRTAAPYIVNHSGGTFVIVIPGGVMRQRDVLEGIVTDVALLQSLGVRLVLVLGSNEQVDAISKARGVSSAVVNGYRVTDPETLEIAMEAAGRNCVLVQALLSRGVNVAVTRRHGDANSWNGRGGGGGGGGGGGDSNAAADATASSGSPLERVAAAARLQPGGMFARAMPTAVSGNFIQAKRRGVVDGVDFLYTGDVVSVDVDAVRVRLDQGDVVLLSSLGFNAAGEVLNCQCYDVAVSCAIDLGADKLVSYVAEGDMPRNEDGEKMKARSPYTGPHTTALAW